MATNTSGAGGTGARVNEHPPEFAALPETPLDDPRPHRIIIVGGGAAGLELATKLGDCLGKRRAASIMLLDRSRTHVWKPLLHELAAGSLDSAVEAVVHGGNARRHRYKYRIGAMYGIDRARKRIHVESTHDDVGCEVVPRAHFRI